MRVFDFGQNWQEFSLQRLDEQRLAIAVESLQHLLQRDRLEGLTVLDVGCGSGLFSLAAHRLGARKVVGIDVNPGCIAISEQNHGRLLPGSQIEFCQLSVLDQASFSTLGQFDLVYAWGSLHHTGALGQAIKNAAAAVEPGGTLVLAIYNKHITSPVWRDIKWFYNQVPAFAQRIMAVLFAGIIYMAKLLVTRRNPLEKERGMDYWYDVIDWIGGYPYEYASRSEVEQFLKTLHFSPVRFVPAQVPTGCNEFVFVKE